ncbi:MAG: hypothetical protein ABJM86_00815 [Hyphomicrobiales bacterium]
MNSVLSGIAVMLLISVIAGFALQSQFNKSSGESYTSPNGSVRLSN